MDLCLSGVDWAVAQCLRQDITPTRLWICPEDVGTVSRTQPLHNRPETFLELVSSRYHVPLAVVCTRDLPPHAWAVGTDGQPFYGSGGA